MTDTDKVHVIVIADSYVLAPATLNAINEKFGDKVQVWSESELKTNLKGKIADGEMDCGVTDHVGLVAAILHCRRVLVGPESGKPLNINPAYVRSQDDIIAIIGKLDQINTDLPKPLLIKLEQVMEPLRIVESSIANKKANQVQTNRFNRSQSEKNYKSKFGKR